VDLTPDLINRTHDEPGRGPGAQRPPIGAENVEVRSERLQWQHGME